MLQFTAHSLKVTLVINANSLAGAKIPDGSPKVPFSILVAGRTVTGALNAKSVRRAIKALAGGECTVIVQGRLIAGDVIEDAGIAALPRTPKMA